MDVVQLRGLVQSVQISPALCTPLGVIVSFPFLSFFFIARFGGCLEQLGAGARHPTEIILRCISVA